MDGRTVATLMVEGRCFRGPLLEVRNHQAPGDRERVVSIVMDPAEEVEHPAAAKVAELELQLRGEKFRVTVEGWVPVAMAMEPVQWHPMGSCCRDDLEKIFLHVLRELPELVQVPAAAIEEEVAEQVPPRDFEKEEGELGARMFRCALEFAEACVGMEMVRAAEVAEQYLKCREELAELRKERGAQ